MKNKVIWVVCLLLLIISFDGCKEKTEPKEPETIENEIQKPELVETEIQEPETVGEDESELDINTEAEVQEELLTVEELIEKCQFTEEEYEGVDLQDFINKWGITESVIATADMHKFLQIYIEQENYVEPEGALHYEYIYDTEIKTELLTKEDLKKIKVIAYKEVYGTSLNSGIIDFEKKEGYYGEQVDLFKEAALATDTAKIDEEQKEEIIKTLDEAEFLWKKVNYDEIEYTVDDHDWYGWSLYFELTDGTIKHYTGNISPEGHGKVEQLFREIQYQSEEW